MKATAPSGSATATRHASCTAGTPYTGAATASSSAHATTVVSRPTMSWAIANDQRGKPAAAKRRSTPRSRYEARWTGSITSPVAAITTVR